MGSPDTIKQAVRLVCESSDVPAGFHGELMAAVMSFASPPVGMVPMDLPEELAQFAVFSLASRLLGDEETFHEYRKATLGDIAKRGWGLRTFLDLRTGTVWVDLPN